MAAISSDIKIDGFENESIHSGNYVCFQHKGSMALIKSTIYQIYKQFIPLSDFVINTNRTLIHYERYDYRFNWNKTNSVIDIFVPIKHNL
ncbi:MAG: GyrI-like domain-containing protein [Pseudomonadales bacterium]|nr:GyrI-like domain-containing protein [Pseudomonadales bacterium]